MVEQDLVHSLYCIPIGHLGTKESHVIRVFLIKTKPSFSGELTALAFRLPPLKEYPVGVTRAGELQQERAVAVFGVAPVAATHLLLTQEQEGLGGDQMSAAEEDAGRLQPAAPGHDLTGEKPHGVRNEK